MDPADLDLIAAPPRLDRRILGERGQDPVAPADETGVAEQGAPGANPSA